jgi:hypothetical protein
MGRAYQALGEDALARQSFAKHLHNRAHGVGSIYETGLAECYLRELGNVPAKSTKAS